MTLRSQAHLTPPRPAPRSVHETVVEAAPRPTNTQAAPAPRGPTAEQYVNAFVGIDGRVHLLSRDPTGKRVVRSQNAEWASFCAAADLKPEERRQLRASRHVAGLVDEGAWVRVQWADPRTRKLSCAKDGWFASKGIATYEADVDPVRRLFVDRPIGVQRPRRCYLDIEADSRVTVSSKESARMLAWSLYDAQTGKLAASAVLAEDSDKAERALVERLWSALEAFDQVCAWAGDFFDFPYLDARTLRRGLRPERKHWLWLDHLTLFRKFNVSASDSGDEKQSLALEAVARSLGLTGKLAGVDRSKSWEEWERDPERLLRYCERDAELMHEIESKTGYIEMLQAIAEAMFIFPDSAGISPSRQVESYMMRLGRERGMRFATHHWRDADDADPTQFKGAFVMEPKRGLLSNVHVFDFSRMYPTIILSWNMSPETLRRDAKPAKRPTYMAHVAPEAKPEGVCFAALTEVAFANEPRGLLPVAIEEMLKLRKVWDDAKKGHAPGTPAWKEADRRSTAYKNAGNAFFGVMGLVYSRFYVRELAESITQCGVWLIQETIAFAEEAGLEVVYGDTDSGFVVGGTREEFTAFVRECNERLYPRLLASRGCTRNLVRLEYEKAFRRLIFVSKKRYAGGYLHFKGAEATADSKPEIKGLEFKRGDTARLARRLQEEVVHTILGFHRPESDDPAVYDALVESYKARVLAGDLPFEDVVIAKKLTKNLRAYKRKVKKGGGYAAQASHVEVARALAERGGDVGAGRRIEYVVVDGEAKPNRCIPAEDFAGAYDAHYLWDQLVYPPTQRVLDAAFPEDVERWKKHERTRPVKPKPTRKGKAKKAPAADRTFDLFDEDGAGGVDPDA